MIGQIINLISFALQLVYANPTHGNLIATIVNFLIDGCGNSKLDIRFMGQSDNDDA